MTNADCPVLSISGLTRCFGANRVLDNISITIPTGSVFGLIGENAAGKSTLIRHILGLLRAQSGTVSVFGQDPVADPVSVLSRIGYLPEDSDLPTWMKVRDLIRYVSSFYPTWDAGYAESMRLSYGIDNNSKIGILSKGQKTRVGLLVALAYHPDLLLLDEPSSGLDPLVRHELLNVLTAVRGEQRTVIFSSHVLSEIDKVCSHVAMLRKGRVAFCDNVSTLRSTYFRATIAPALSRETALSLAGVLDWEELGPQCTIVFRSPSEPLVESIAGLGCAISDCVPLSLEDLFMVYSRMEHLPQ